MMVTISWAVELYCDNQLADVECIRKFEFCKMSLPAGGYIFLAVCINLMQCDLWPNAEGIAEQVFDCVLI